VPQWRSSAAHAVPLPVVMRTGCAIDFFASMLQARFLQLGGEVQTALRAALWNTPLRDGAEAAGSSALAAISALEGSLRMAAETVAGCTDDWTLPDTASARIGAQHLTQVSHLALCAHCRHGFCARRLASVQPVCSSLITDLLQRLLLI